MLEIFEKITQKAKFVQSPSPPLSVPCLRIKRKNDVEIETFYMTFIFTLYFYIYQVILARSTS